MKVFIKNNWKTILISTGLFLLLYAGALWYTQRSTPELVETDASLGEAVLQGLTQEEYIALKEDEVSFSFYVENTDDTAFMNYNLLKNYLLSPQTLSQIKEGLDLEYEVLDYYVINISRDTTQALHINIGTGDYADNIALANRIYSLINEDKLDFFEDKDVYLLTQPKRILTTEQSNTETSEVQPTSVNYVILGMLGFIISLFLGTVSAVLLSFFKKEYTLTSLAHFKGMEDVINLTHLKESHKQEEYLSYSILNPSPLSSKLVLMQKPSKELKEKLHQENIFFAESLLEIAISEKVEEVILVIEKNVTQKKWYHDQQMLLENFNVPIKIILL